MTTLDASKNEFAHRWPYFLPDGHHFLYLAGPPYSTTENPTTAIRVGSLDSKQSKLLVYTHASAIYASGHLLFLRQNTLMGQPFDANHLELAGDAFPIEDLVFEDTSIVRGVFSASENGWLTYVDRSSGGGRQLTWVDRSGKKMGRCRGRIRVCQTIHFARRKKDCVHSILFRVRRLELRRCAEGEDSADVWLGIIGCECVGRMVSRRALDRVHLLPRWENMLCAGSFRTGPALMSLSWKGRSNLSGRPIGPRMAISKSLEEAHDRDDTLLIAVRPVRLQHEVNLGNPEDWIASEPSNINLAAGGAAWLPRGKHHVKNLSERPAHFITIEF